jgi:hypothetical protein
MRGILVLAAVVTAALLTAACGAPPGVAARGVDVPEPSSKPPQPTTGLPPGYTPRAIPSSTPMPTPFPEYTAVDCAGRPTKDQVIAVVKRETNINPSDAIAAPLCAGTWQYTVLSVPGRDPVQVLTRSGESGLVLVAAGTDVCSLDIQHQAPSGIFAAANC